MKKIFFLTFLGLITYNALSQEIIIIPNDSEWNDNYRNPITTAVPFAQIAGDARSAGLADMGVATSSDAFSQQWNASKYAFAISKQGVGVTYTPYLSSLVNDIFLGNLTYYNRINERSAVGASLRYFSLGDIEAREDIIQEPLILSPNELLFDLSYSIRLDDRFSMGITGRYLRSDLKLQVSQEDASAGNSFAVDVSGYYQSEEVAYDSFDGRWRGGFNISNIGPKMKYDDVSEGSFVPTKLALGGGFDFILDEYNKIGVNVEFTKLLVPTPPIRGTEFLDLNGNGELDLLDEDGNIYETVIDSDAIYAGKDPDVSFFKGMTQSFGDAPNGFSEELTEVTWAIGAEYWFRDVFAFRAGYFNEHESKGARKYMTLGAGFKYTTIVIDLSYLISTSTVVSPLEGTLRFGLTFNFGDEYDEY